MPVRLTIILGFAWCWEWPKLIRSRRAFHKTAFLTLTLPCVLLRLSRLQELVPTLHCLIIILISMLPWMWIAEQNLAFSLVWMKSGAWNSQPKQRVLRTLDGPPLHKQSSWSPVRGLERQRGILLPNFVFFLPLHLQLLRLPLIVPCYWIVWYIPNTRGPVQVRCPVEWMLPALIGASPQRGSWPGIPVGSMTFPRSLTLSLVTKVNKRLFTLLQMSGWLERHSEETRTTLHITFTACLTGAVFPTTAFTCHLLSHGTTCQVLTRNVFAHSSFRNGKLKTTLSKVSHWRDYVHHIKCIALKEGFYCHSRLQNGNQTPSWKI